MLDVAKLGAGRERYYTGEIADSREAYYTGHGEASAGWWGAESAAMGLHGTAADGTEQGDNPFHRVYYGQDPRTGQLLGAKHRRDGVHAFDLVFRPVKSVSVVYALGDREAGAACWAAHHAGIAQAVAYLEQHVGARRGQTAQRRSRRVGCWRSGSTTG